MARPARCPPADGSTGSAAAWLAYIRVQPRLAYEMNRQLLADGGLSLPDYDALTALSVAAGAGADHGARHPSSAL
jgi:hypothetical protein